MNKEEIELISGLQTRLDILERLFENMPRNQEPVVFMAPCEVCHKDTSNVSHIAGDVKVPTGIDRAASSTIVASTTLVYGYKAAVRTCLECGKTVFFK